MAQFSGFSKDAFGFFKALAFHQNREWFHENKALYESEVKEPMLALLEALSERFKKEKIPLRGDKKSVFRINRDVRFSKNKQPYQTHTGAVLTPSGAKDDPGLLYIHISAPDLDSMGGRCLGELHGGRLPSAGDGSAHGVSHRHPKEAEGVPRHGGGAEKGEAQAQYRTTSSPASPAASRI